MKRTMTGFVAALLVSTAAHAIPVSYALNFDVAFISNAIPSDPDLHIGNRYLGSFTVDDALLLHDGLNQPGSLNAFRVQFEDVIWDMNDPALFGGFRGPNGFGLTPGFDVLGGQVVNLRGGIFGRGDFPFIDFSVDSRLGAFSSASQAGAFGGTMSVARVPEPPLPLWALASVLAAFLYGRRAGWFGASQPSRSGLSCSPGR